MRLSSKLAQLQWVLPSEHLSEAKACEREAVEIEERVMKLEGDLRAMREWRDELGFRYNRAKGRSRPHPASSANPAGEPRPPVNP